MSFTLYWSLVWILIVEIVLFWVLQQWKECSACVFCACMHVPLFLVCVFMCPHIFYSCISMQQEKVTSYTLFDNLTLTLFLCVKNYINILLNIMISLLFPFSCSTCRFLLYNRTAISWKAFQLPSNYMLWINHPFYNISQGQNQYWRPGNTQCMNFLLNKLGTKVGSLASSMSEAKYGGTHL